jgi:hypothetical protein
MSNRTLQHVTSQFHVLFYSALISALPSVCQQPARGPTRLPQTCEFVIKRRSTTSVIGTTVVFIVRAQRSSSYFSTFYYPRTCDNINGFTLILRALFSIPSIYTSQVHRKLKVRCLSEIPNVRPDSDAWQADEAQAAEKHRSSYRQTSRASGGFGHRVPALKSKWGCSAQGFSLLLNGDNRRYRILYSEHISYIFYGPEVDRNIPRMW